MARSQTQAAIDLTRDEDDGIVRTEGDNVYVEFDSKMPYAASKLVRDHGFLISARSLRDGVTLFA